MKNFRLNHNKILLSLILFLSGISSFGQSNNSSLHTTHEERSSLQAQLITNELGLSEPQKQQLYSILLERSKKMMESREAKKEDEVNKAEKEYQIKFMNILNEDQLKKYKELEREKERNPPH
jgi:hypothetical protein